MGGGWSHGRWRGEDMGTLFRDGVDNERYLRSMGWRPAAARRRYVDPRTGVSWPMRDAITIAQGKTVVYRNVTTLDGKGVAFCRYIDGELDSVVAHLHHVGPIDDGVERVGDGA